MMFSFFKSRPKPLAGDLVFADRQAKWQALLQAARQDPAPLFVAWFEESLESLQQFFNAQDQAAELCHYRQVHSGNTRGRKLVFIEHFPLAGKERQLLSSLDTTAITVYSSLDEAFFRYFGGDNIATLLTKLGLDKNEAVSHPMISKAIARAQEKLEKNILIEQPATSMEEWVQKNTTGINNKHR